MLGRGRLSWRQRSGGPRREEVVRLLGGRSLGAPSHVAGSQPPEPGGRKRPIEAEGGQLALSAPFSSQSLAVDSFTAHPPEGLEVFGE